MCGYLQQVSHFLARDGLDVGIRRIQIDSNEWARWIFYLKRILIFWRPSDDNITQEESLNSLLTKRNKKRQELLQRQKINFNELISMKMSYH